MFTVFIAIKPAIVPGCVFVFVVVLLFLLSITLSYNNYSLWQNRSL